MTPPRHWHRWALALVIGAAQVLAFAQTPRPAQPAGPATLTASPAPPAAAGVTQPAVASASAEYRLGAGDVIRVTVYQNPDLTTESRLTETGLVTFPLLGSIRLGGLSVTQAEKLITDGLRNGNFVRQPQVTLVVLVVRGNQASLLGQFNRPGRYPLEVADMRLTDLVALAGGVAPYGADQIVITGLREGRPMRVEVDLPALFAPGGRERDILIHNGDAIWVDRQPVLYIYGEVQRPGALRLERGMTLIQVLAAGGGLTARGTERGIRVHRRAGDGRTQVLTPTMDSPLQDGDVVFVRESLF